MSEKYYFNYILISDVLATNRLVCLLVADDLMKSFLYLTIATVTLTISYSTHTIRNGVLELFNFDTSRALARVKVRHLGEKCFNIVELFYYSIILCHIIQYYSTTVCCVSFE